MPESTFAYLAMILSGFTAAAFGYASARFGGHTSLAISNSATSATLTIDERTDLRAEAEALRQEVKAEMERLRIDNQGLRERLGIVENELNTTRLTNITLEHDRNRSSAKVSELEAEVERLRRQVNGGALGGE